MAGYVKHPVGKEFISRNLVGKDIKIGAFVNINFANNTYVVPTADATGNIAFVANEIDHLVPHNVDDKDYVVKVGEPVKGKPVVDTEVYVTDQIGTTYATINQGDEVGVGVDGKVYLVADLTAANFTAFKTTFRVEKKVKLMMENALVLTANVK